VDAALEIGDELLALCHRPAVRDRSRFGPALRRLDERDVLLGHLVIPRHELVDLPVGYVDAEVVVGHLRRAAESVRVVALERDVRDPVAMLSVVEGKRKRYCDWGTTPPRRCPPPLPEADALRPDSRAT
jgi:hypothetical protein